MEIWNWVEKLQDDLGEAGQPQNAQLLTRLTDHICDLQIDRAEALLPEARALCAGCGLPRPAARIRSRIWMRWSVTDYRAAIGLIQRRLSPGWVDIGDRGVRSGATLDARRCIRRQQHAHCSSATRRHSRRHTLPLWTCRHTVGGAMTQVHALRAGAGRSATHCRFCGVWSCLVSSVLMELAMAVAMPIGRASPQAQNAVTRRRSAIARARGDCTPTGWRVALHARWCGASAQAWTGARSACARQCHTAPVGG